MKRIGLQARILLLAATAVVTIFAADFATGAYVQVRSAQQRMGEQSRSIGAALMLTLQSDLVVGDLAAAQQTLDRILQQGHFGRMDLLDATGNEVLVAGRLPDKPDRESGAPRWFANLPGLRAEPVRIPIQAGGVHYGVLRVEPSTEALAAGLWYQLGLSFALSLSVLVIALPLLILTLRSGLKPLRELAASARQFGDGDFSRRAPETSLHEVAQTARAFNLMADNIEKLLGELQPSNATIRSMNETLEQRVQERTEALETANEELEAFSYSVSHDLRAPLRALDGYSNLLAKDPESRISPQGSHFLDRIQASSRKMEQLIDDLLELARVGRHELAHAPVDLSAHANEIRNALEEQAQERSVEWRIAPDLQVSGDPVLLKVLLDNLLRNAWKFTAEKKDARIEFSACMFDGTQAFCVRDNGAGFEMAYVDKLFQPFQRLHNVKRFEGTGIGLATVQRIIQRHGGRVWAEGRPNEGAAFYFTLP